MSRYYLGVDLTSRAARASAYALLGEGIGPIELGYVTSDEELLTLAATHRPWTVAIDAPLGLPAGWRCLEEPCRCGDCTGAAEARRRTCEVELRQRGIPCYWTTRRAIIKAMVYRGIELRQRLTTQGTQVLEAYPYGVKRILWGRGIPKKTTAEGLAFLWNRLFTLFPTLTEQEHTPNHDLADALLAAYTARLYDQGRAVLLGVASEGQIVLPRL